MIVEIDILADTRHPGRLEVRDKVPPSSLVERGDAWVSKYCHQSPLDLRAGAPPLKKELSLDHIEGRSWIGLHRHALMTMIAYAFLQARRLLAAGRKKSLGTAAATDFASRTTSDPQHLRQATTDAMPARS